MIVYRASSRISLTLDTRSPLGVGGEAQVLPVIGADSLVAKIYHHVDRVDEAKLRVMIANPPNYPDSAAGHALIAWPIDLLADTQDRVCGFLMTRVTQMRPLIDFYNPSRRRRNHPLFSYRYLHRMAQNLATAFKVLHGRGYVIGDVNQVNILGNEQALVTLVDADSFQVSDGAKRVFRCTVGTPEFTPPELAGKSFGQIDRGPEHDLFGLGVLIFRLLMGVHPFDGRYHGAGDPPSLEQRIAAGHFVYGRQKGGPYSPPPNALPIEVIDPALRELLEQCFNAGHKAPLKRPEAQAWKSALSDAEDRLSQCRAQPLHFYGRHLSACPWCERARQLGGQDAFAPPANAQSNRSAPPQAQEQPASTPKVPAAKRRRTINPHAFGLAGMVVAVTGLWLGRWAIWPGAVAIVLSFIGMLKSQRVQKGAILWVLGTVLGVGSIALGWWRLSDDDEMLDLSRRDTEQFLHDLSANNVRETSTLPRQELHNLYSTIKDLGQIQHVDLVKFNFVGSDCYLEGDATFEKGQRHFTAHVSIATIPHSIEGFSIDAPDFGGVVDRRSKAE